MFSLESVCRPIIRFALVVAIVLGAILLSAAIADAAICPRPTQPTQPSVADQLAGVERMCKELRRQVSQPGGECCIWDSEAQRQIVATLHDLAYTIERQPGNQCDHGCSVCDSGGRPRMQPIRRAGRGLRAILGRRPGWIVPKCR